MIELRKSCLLLLMSILLFGGTVTAQDTRQTPEEAATRLMSEGLQLANEGSPASLNIAIDKFESARELLHSLNIPVGEGAALAMLGGIYTLLDQNQKAMEMYEQSLAFFRVANEKKGEATVLLQLGLIHSKSGEMQKGLDYLDRALSLFHEAGERQGEAIALGTIGSLHIFLGKPEDMVNYYNRVFELSSATASRGNEAVAMPVLDPVYKLMSLNLVEQPEKGREGLEQLLSVSRSL